MIATISVVQSASDAVIIRRVLLWGVLGVLLAVATHGPRDSIASSERETARLQEQLTPPPGTRKRRRPRRGDPAVATRGFRHGGAA
jgi:hypothetical protein